MQLVKDGASVAVTTTDNYGDFKFDRLDENSGRYTVQIFAGGRSKTGGDQSRRQHQSRRDQVVDQSSKVKSIMSS